jgi:hypothetical protein
MTHENKKSDQDDDDKIIRVVVEEGTPIPTKYVPTPLEIYRGYR